jgi:hypothetical protein
VSVLLTVLLACVQDVDGDGYTSDVDCDDGSDLVHPGATERCNQVDDDCDDAVDEVVTQTYWLDGDQDGYGDKDSPLERCSLEAGMAEISGDCDDTRGAVHPGAPEGDCTDPIDYNCDGSTGYADEDGDGWPACEDCDDGQAGVSPDAEELCNGVDDDCDGLIDWFAVDGEQLYLDDDGDGWGGGEPISACDSQGYVAEGGDCDDGDSSVHPTADETCDGRDEDCDGTVDDDPVDGSTWYQDWDSDGYGDASATRAACEEPFGYVDRAGDCDDGSAEVNPGADEVCDGLDNDCDSEIDFGNRVPTDHSSIEDAIDANSSGDTICVEAGTYTEDIDFRGRDLALHGVGGSAAVTLKGSGKDPVVTFKRGESSRAELVGFTITGGEAEQGAGVYIRQADPTLEDLVITANSCSESTCEGVGLFVDEGDPSLTQVEISSNVSSASSTTYGAGAAFYDSNATLQSVDILDNTAVDGNSVWGAGLYSSGGALVASNVWISGNEAEGSSIVTGSGMSMNSGDLSSFTNLVVAGNRGTTTGGTVYAVGLWSYSSASVTLENASFVGNVADASSSAWGVAATAYSSGEIVGVNVDVSDNLDDGGNAKAGGWAAVYGGDVELSYSNVYGNDSDDFYDIDDPTGTDGNISKNPKYVDTSSSDPGSWDLSLAASSALIDAGDGSLVDSDGSTSDIGAYGGEGAADW